MKKVVFSVLLVSLLFSFLSCADDDNNSDGLSEIERRIVGTWEVQTVFLNGFDVTNPSYTDFAILFRPDRSYFAIDSEPIFTPSGGFWQFLDNDPDRLEIGGVESMLSLDDDTMILVFQATGEQIGESGRRKGLDGDYEFTLTRTT
ncbi:MAG: hypothetical protein AAGA64_08490, partial [Bacteroidota bacterium]